MLLIVFWLCVRFDIKAFFNTLQILSFSCNTCICTCECAYICTYCKCTCTCAGICTRTCTCTFTCIDTCTYTCTCTCTWEFFVWKNCFVGSKSYRIKAKRRIWKMTVSIGATGNHQHHQNYTTTCVFLLLSFISTNTKKQKSNLWTDWEHVIFKSGGSGPGGIREAIWITHGRYKPILQKQTAQPQTM